MIITLSYKNCHDVVAILSSSCSHLIVFSEVAVSYQVSFPVKSPHLSNEVTQSSEVAKLD